MTKNTKPTKAKMVAELVAAGKGAEAKLRRHNNATLAAMIEEARAEAAKPKTTKKPAKPSIQTALARVADLLGLTLGETVKKAAYSRTDATDAEGTAFVLYRNRTNVGIVPKGMSRAAARELLTTLQKTTGGTIRETKAELLVPDVAA